MAKSSGKGGGVTRPTGPATQPKGSSTRGFVPQGNKGGGSGPAIRRTAGDLKVGPRTASGKVEGKG